MQGIRRTQRLTLQGRVTKDCPYRDRSLVTSHAALCFIGGHFTLICFFSITFIPSSLKQRYMDLHFWGPAVRSPPIRSSTLLPVVACVSGRVPLAPCDVRRFIVRVRVSSSGVLGVSRRLHQRLRCAAGLEVTSSVWDALPSGLNQTVTCAEQRAVCF